MNKTTKRITGGLGALAGVFLLKNMIPSLRRYMRIRRM